MPELRALIREILAEELAAIRSGAGGAPAVERVRIADNRDLTAFARDLLERASDPRFAAAVRDGSVVFALEGGSAAAPAIRAETPRYAAPPAEYAAPVTTVPPAVPELTKGLITERDIAAIPEGQTRLRVARNSRLTPLAGDEARRRKIRIERMTT